jgi:hypothetical protein
MEPETFSEPVRQEETAKAKNFFARLGGVFSSPREAFTEIGHAPRILIPVIAVFLLSAFSAWYVSIKVDNLAILESQLGGFIERMPEEQRAAMIAQASQPSNPVPGAIAGGISSLIACLLIAGYGKIFSTITGAENRYKSLFEVSLYAIIVITVVSTVLTVTILQIKAPGSAIAYEMPTIASNLGAMIEIVVEKDVLPKFIMNLAKAVDVFVIWAIALLAIGFNAVSVKLKTSTAAIWMGGIYVIFAVIAAAIGSVIGR